MLCFQNSFNLGPPSKLKGLRKLVNKDRSFIFNSAPRFTFYSKAEQIKRRKLNEGIYKHFNRAIKLSATVTVTAKQVNFNTLPIL